jgi:2,3-bisphosphoglycerate-dependent phosphoglycerate mutase
VTAARDHEPATGTYPQARFTLPPDAVELLLVRHGQSQDYVAGTTFPLVAGQGDPPLSPLGRQQAERVCARLAAAGDPASSSPLGGPVGAIYGTTLCRTVQTAAPLAERLGLKIEVEPRLREVSLGEWEGGLYRKMVADGHPIALAVFEQERWDVIPGAEESAAFAGRVRAAILALAAAHAGQRVAVFTHGGVIGQALALATGARPFSFIGADNASISRLVITDSRWIVRGFNDTTHLE